jgi:hypothetical protein
MKRMQIHVQSARRNTVNEFKLQCFAGKEFQVCFDTTWSKVFINVVSSNN